MNSSKCVMHGEFLIINFSLTHKFLGRLASLRISIFLAIAPSVTDSSHTSFNTSFMASSWLLASSMGTHIHVISDVHIY